MSVSMKHRLDSPPDLILVNGTIITVDANDSIAQAVAIPGNKIVAVGNNAMSTRWQGQTRGGLILPVAPLTNLRLALTAR